MGKSGRVLVVEDEVILLLDLVDSLVDFGLEPLPVTTASGAASLLGDNIAGLITDIELPGAYDGLQLARLAARSRPGLPIVVVSAGVRPSREDLPTGAVFLPKPYRVEDIVAALESQRIARAA
ncbi:DNA-binding transcriptional response regulator [Devosia rhizoryzae]|uniref:Response regulator n=1 Tax=Devosia rhizoryzae TaxID=2774137 RepID=A0ABX7C9S1_9HYPH|nr:response regulator [Devosia rhizoryzae]QQR39954.1 response regulator [Devosia rhizoryzae]